MTASLFATLVGLCIASRAAAVKMCQAAGQPLPERWHSLPNYGGLHLHRGLRIIGSVLCRASPETC